MNKFDWLHKVLDFANRNPQMFPHEGEYFDKHDTLRMILALDQSKEVSLEALKEGVLQIALSACKMIHQYRTFMYMPWYDGDEEEEKLARRIDIALDHASWVVGLLEGTLCPECGDPSDLMTESNSDLCPQCNKKLHIRCMEELVVSFEPPSDSSPGGVEMESFCPDCTNFLREENYNGN